MVNADLRNILNKSFPFVKPTHSSVLLGDKRMVDFESAVCRWCFFREACNTASSYDEFISLGYELAREG